MFPEGGQTRKHCFVGGQTTIFPENIRIRFNNVS
jgi:hypothetical protein